MRRAHDKKCLDDSIMVDTSNGVLPGPGVSVVWLVIRTIGPNTGRLACGCLCHVDAQTLCGTHRLKCITPSSQL